MRPPPTRLCIVARRAVEHAPTRLGPRSGISGVPSRGVRACHLTGAQPAAPLLPRPVAPPPPGGAVQRGAIHGVQVLGPRSTPTTVGMPYAGRPLRRGSSARPPPDQAWRRSGRAASTMDRCRGTRASPPAGVRRVAVPAPPARGPRRCPATRGCPPARRRPRLRPAAGPHRRRGRCSTAAVGLAAGVVRGHTCPAARQSTRSSICWLALVA